MSAGRKKSIIGANGVPSIEIPQSNNTLLNKSASQSTSLYQQCSQLRARLMSIRNFAPFLDLVIPQEEPRKSTDMVHDLWDHLQLGIPLVFLFNLLPPPAVPIQNIDTDPNGIDLDLMGRKDPAARKSKQRPIAQVVMAITRLQKEGHWKPDLNFTVTDLLEDSTNGFVKVVQTLTFLVDSLPPDVFIEPNPTAYSPPSNTSQSSFHTSTFPDADVPEEVERKNIIREMLETERKYVQDLEVMQHYSTALLQGHIIDQDTIHHLFPGLLKLLDFQRRFLIQMEQTAEHSWKEQAWGKLFTTNEEEFEVYEPYCANYTNATELLLAEEQNLMSLADVIHPKSELPAFLIKPVQRICKYPLLLESLLKKSNREEYPLYDDLVAGVASAKLITDKINEAQRRAENAQTVRALQNRVEDWKGHHLANFGDLLLDDVLLVTKSEVDREYHVFLFEKIILCCKEAVVISNKKGSKNSSLLKKQSLPGTPIVGGSGLSKKKNTPLLLKGRIFINNVTSARKVNLPGDSSHSLRVFWRGEDDAEYFTLRCRSEEQLKQWETAIMKLVTACATRRASERHQPNSTSPAIHLRHSTTSGGSISMSTQGQSYSSVSRFTSSYRSDQWQQGAEIRPQYPQTHTTNVNSIYPTSVAGLVQHPYGEDTLNVVEQDHDQFPPHGPPVSGRGTPLSGRRSDDPYMPNRYDRTRAQEETNGPVMSQWRYNGMPPPPPPPTGNIPPPPPLGAMPARPPISSRNGSEISFSSAGIPSGPALRSKFSTTKLRVTYDDEPQPHSSFSRNGSQASLLGAGTTRARTTSTPAQYNGPKANPPPLPTSSQMRTNGDRNRGSGSSQSTGDSSDYSPPQTGSTSFGSIDTSVTSVRLTNPNLRPVRSQVFTGPRKEGPKMLVKVRYGEDLFTLDVPRSIEYEELLSNVGHKVRRCGPRRTPGPLRIKYQDEDGDLVSLGTTEDVQLAFDMAGGTLTLYVA